MLGREGDNAIADRSKIIVEHQVVNGIHSILLLYIIFYYILYAQFICRNDRDIFFHKTKNKISKMRVN